MGAPEDTSTPVFDRFELQFKYLELQYRRGRLDALHERIGSLLVLLATGDLASIGFLLNREMPLRVPTPLEYDVNAIIFFAASLIAALLALPMHLIANPIMNEKKGYGIGLWLFAVFASASGSLFIVPFVTLIMSEL